MNLYRSRYHTRRSIVTESLDQSRLHDVTPSRHITTACLYADFRDRSDELECDPRFRGQTKCVNSFRERRRFENQSHFGHLAMWNLVR